MPDQLFAPPTPRHGGRFVFCLVFALLLVLPATVRADDSQNLSLCKQILSRMLCKNVNEFGYSGKVDQDVYIISVFYATKSSELLCAVLPDGQVVLQDRTWRAMRRVVPYTLTSGGRCMSVNYFSPDCPAKKGSIKVCQPKRARDVKEQRSETFWNRPIPKILEEEYKAMNKRDQQNATAPAPASEAPAPAP